MTSARSATTPTIAPTTNVITSAMAARILALLADNEHFPADRVFDSAAEREALVLIEDCDGDAGDERQRGQRGRDGTEPRRQEMRDRRFRETAANPRADA